MFRTTCYINFFNPLSSWILLYLFFPLKIKTKQNKKPEGVVNIASVSVLTEKKGEI